MELFPDEEFAHLVDIIPIELPSLQWTVKLRLLVELDRFSGINHDDVASSHGFLVGLSSGQERVAADHRVDMSPRPEPVALEDRLIGVGRGRDDIAAIDGFSWMIHGDDFHACGLTYLPRNILPALLSGAVKADLLNSDNCAI